VRALDADDAIRLDDATAVGPGQLCPIVRLYRLVVTDRVDDLELPVRGVCEVADVEVEPSATEFEELSELLLERTVGPRDDVVLLAEGRGSLPQ
jgi:hypothetical protein